MPEKRKRADVVAEMIARDRVERAELEAQGFILPHGILACALRLVMTSDEYED